MVYPRSELGDCTNVDEYKRMATSNAALGLYPLLAVFYRYLPVVAGRHELLEELAYCFVRSQANNHVIYSEVRAPH